MELDTHNVSESELETQTRRRRNLLKGFGVAGSVAVLPSQWQGALVDAIVLPAHAQTSICVADTTAGGPLAGNASGATTCQAACEAEAAAQNAQLCSVSESVDASNATQCSCELDLP